jgi:hypothetical protein
MEFLEILKYTIPSVVVFATAYYILNLYLQGEERRHRNEQVVKSQKIVTPIRLQAYERVTLFLERISPESLLTRVREQNMTSRQFQSALLNNIRQEFEHNLSQQIYMTNEAWQMVVNTKESIIQLVNVAAGRFNQEATAIDLSKMILDMMMQAEVSPIRKALDFIKNEVNLLVNVQKE